MGSPEVGKVALGFHGSPKKEKKLGESVMVPDFADSLG